MERFVIIGAGQAAISLAAKLRHSGFEGSITMIGDEQAPPYQRPPLSKAYLLGEMTLERLYLKNEAFYGEKEIDLRTGISVASIERDAKTVTLSDGSTLPYDKLAITTGTRPRHLPKAIGGELEGVYYVRTLADADAMAHEFTQGKKLLVVGGGYIGLEAAAVAAKRGVSVVLVEAADRILQRVAAPETSDFFRTLHRSHNVEIIEGCGLEKLIEENGRVSGAILANGTKISCDFAVVGIGVHTNHEIAQEAGLEIENGLKVGSNCATSDPAIFAAGDVTSFPYRGNRIRLESVPNAIDQGEAAARAMMGEEVDYNAKPWFRSDQYDVKLQIAGLNKGYNRIVTRDGAREGSKSFWYYNDKELLAVDAMNDPRAYMMGKRWIESGHSPDPDALAKPDADMKAL